MSDRILLATRKGLLDFAKRGNTWVIAGQSFLGQPVSAVLRDPDNAFLYAALNLGHFGVKLHRSKDDGNSWEEIACPSYTGIATDSEEKANLQLIWILERDHQGHLWAGTIPGGLFKSTDNGDTWQLNEFLWHNPARKEWFGGGYDSPGIHSICIDPKRAGYMALAISCGGVWLSEDYGETWRPSTKGMVADYLPPEQADNPNQQDPIDWCNAQVSQIIFGCSITTGFFIQKIAAPPGQGYTHRRHPLILLLRCIQKILNKRGLCRVLRMNTVIRSIVVSA